MAEAEVLDTTHWVEDSRTRLESAIEYAGQVIESGNATQAAVDMAERLLTEAMENSEVTAEADKVVLNAQISQGTAVGPTGYTEESYSKLQEAWKKPILRARTAGPARNWLTNARQV